MGRGYLLPVEREAEMRRSMRWLMAFSLLLGGGFGVVLLRMVTPVEAVPLATWLIGGAAFAAGLAVIVYLQSRMSRGLEPMQGPAPQQLENGSGADVRCAHPGLVASVSDSGCSR